MGAAFLGKLVIEAVSAAALLAGFFLFLKGLRDQRAAFQEMMAAQVDALNTHTAVDSASHKELAGVIGQCTAVMDRNVNVLDRVEEYIR